MSLVINHNLMAMNAARNLGEHYGELAVSTRRLSSGLRVGNAADDAAGLAIRELMRSDIASLHQGVRNANDAISMIQTADGALQVIDEKLIRMKELAVQAATGTYNSDQRMLIESEYQAMASEITRIANATDFNGIHMLNGSLAGLDPNTQQPIAHNGNGLNPTGPVKIHFGTGNDSAEDYYYISVNNSTASALGLANSHISTQRQAQLALAALQNAIISKDKIRANLGAMQNRLENTITNLTIQAGKHVLGRIPHLGRGRGHRDDRVRAPADPVAVRRGHARPGELPAQDGHAAHQRLIEQQRGRTVRPFRTKGRHSPRKPATRPLPNANGADPIKDRPRSRVHAPCLRPLFLRLQRPDGRGRGHLLGSLDAAALAEKHAPVRKRHLHPENLGVLRPVRGFQAVDRQRLEALLRDFLQPALVVLGRAHFRRVRPAFPEKPKNQRLGGQKPAVQENRAENGLQRVGQERVALPAALGFLALAEQQVLVQAQGAGRVGQAFFLDQAGPDSGHLPLGGLRKAPVDLLADAQLQHGVAEELQPLVVLAGVFSLIGVRTMDQRAAQELDLRKVIVNTILNARQMFIHEAGPHAADQKRRRFVCPPVRHRGRGVRPS